MTVTLFSSTELGFQYDLFDRESAGGRGMAKPLDTEAADMIAGRFSPLLAAINFLACRSRHCLRACPACFGKAGRSFRARRELRSHDRFGGFTLIELLVAASIMGLVVMAVGAALAGGLRSWQAVRQHLLLEAAVLPGLAIWERDLMNAEFNYYEPLRGGAEGMVIPLALPAARGATAEQTLSAVPGFVRYSYDSSRRAVMRTAWPAGDTEPPSDRAEAWIENVDAVSIRYWGAASRTAVPDQGAVVWENRFELPAAARLGLTLSSSGERVTNIERFIVLPRDSR